MEERQKILFGKDIVLCHTTDEYVKKRKELDDGAFWEWVNDNNEEL